MTNKKKGNQIPSALTSDESQVEEVEKFWSGGWKKIYNP